MAQWVAWLSAAIVAVFTLVVFIYANFETKDGFASYRSDEQRLEEQRDKRLERIEDKIDQLITRASH